MAKVKLEIIGEDKEQLERLGIERKHLTAIANKIGATHMHYLDKFKGFKCMREGVDKHGRKGRKQLGIISLNQIGKYHGLRIDEVADSQVATKYQIKLTRV